MRPKILIWVATAVTLGSGLVNLYSDTLALEDLKVPLEFGLYRLQRP